MFDDLSKFKEIFDKIINLQGIDDIDERSAYDYVEDTDSKSLAVISCLRLISRLIVNLVVDLEIVKPGNKISVIVNSAILKCDDNAVSTLLNTIYSEVDRKTEDFDDYIYQKHVMVICKQIKMISDYIIADSSILNDIIKEVSTKMPSFLWWARVLQTEKNINKNEVK